MKKTLARALAGAFFCGAAATAADSPSTSATTLAGDSRRGDYLVNGIGLCADCHSPRDAQGQFIKSAWLQGAPIGFKPLGPMPAWAEVAPPIAGLPTMLKDEEAMRFLTSGIRPDGTMARPPMPAYRLSEADARDVLAYLRSLARPKS
jgi:mono/diheme cytochrome c family protein